MQSYLGENLTEFIRHYLASDGLIVKKDEVYFVLKQKVDRNQNALAELNRIKQYSKYYEKIINPEKENNTTIYINLARLRRLDFTVLYPFLLNCYYDYEHNILSAKDFAELLNILENFLIRRLVCNIANYVLNKIFPGIYNNSVKTSVNFIDNIKQILEAQKYPKDVKFHEELMKSAFYAGDNKTRLMLETFECYIAYKESPAFLKAEIEQIMPQSLTTDWKRHLGDNWQLHHDLHLDSLGNLTLTAPNPELSNIPFSAKKEYFKNSLFSLNNYFASIDRWDAAAIDKRSQYLADIALKIWSYFGISQKNTTEENSVTGTKPYLLIILGDEIIVRTWKDVYISLLNWIIEYEHQAITKISIQYPNFVTEDPTCLRRFEKLNNNFYAEINLSADSIYRFCGHVIQCIGLSDDDWEIKTK
jgi:hypothetical protein